MSDQKVASFWGCSSSRGRSSSNASVTTANSSVAANVNDPTSSNTVFTEYTNESLSSDNNPNHSIEDDFYLIYENENDKRKRQKLMSDKLQTLRNLLPDSHQKDHEALLDDAASYIKSLQQQLEMISRCNEEEKQHH